MMRTPPSRASVPHPLSLHFPFHAPRPDYVPAARHPPRYVELLYRGDPEHADDVIMVLGKGITFDSGGLNMKGTGFMEDMHVRLLLPHGAAPCGAGVRGGTALRGAAR